MKRRKQRIGAAATLAILMLSGSILGQETEKHVKIVQKGPDACGAPCCGLKLDATQQNQFKDLDLKLDKELLPLKSDLKVLDAELDKLLIADKPDQDAIGQKIEKIGALKVQIEKAKVKNRLAKRALLTDEQRVHFDKCGCMSGDADKGMHMMFMGQDGEKKVIKIKKTGKEGEPMMWRDKDCDVQIEIKKEMEEVEEEE